MNRVNRLISYLGKGKINIEKRREDRGEILNRGRRDLYFDRVDVPCNLGGESQENNNSAV